MTMVGQSSNLVSPQEQIAKEQMDHREEVKNCKACLLGPENGKEEEDMPMMKRIQSILR